MSKLKVQPTSQEVRDILKRNGLTSIQAGKILDVDARTIRRYTGLNNSKGLTKMPWSMWAFLRIMLGELSVQDATKEIEI